MKIFLFTFGGPILLARMIIALIATLLATIGMFIVGMILGNKKPLGRYLLSYIAYLLGRTYAVCVSILSLSHNYPTTCYKKYLGPDWKPTYDRPSTIVANHSSWVDIVMMMTKYTPSFISKAAVKKLPGIGYMASLNHTLYMDRASKEDRKLMFAKISDHQQRAEAGEISPLIMHPEGGTTNGTALAQFKTGAFAGLHSV